MTKIVIVAVILSVVIFDVTEAKKREIPSYIKKCNMKSVQLKKCLEENIEIIRPHLYKGIPEMRIPPLQPLNLPKVTIAVNNFNLTTTNLLVFDTVKYQVKDFDIDSEHHTMKIEMFYPTLRFLGDYTVDGRLLVLALKGSGKSDVNASDVTSIVTLRGAPHHKNGKTYMDYNNNTIDMKIGKSRVNFDGLFGGNKELSDTTNRVINDNIEDFVKELMPYVNETVGAFIFGIIRSIFETFPLEELFESSMSDAK